MNVEFSEEKNGVPSAYSSSGSSRGGILGWVQRMGLAKNSQQAQKVLIGVALLAVLLAGILLFSGGTHVPPQNVAPTPQPSR